MRLGQSTEKRGCYRSPQSLVSPLWVLWERALLLGKNAFADAIAVLNLVSASGTLPSKQDGCLTWKKKSWQSDGKDGGGEEREAHSWLQNISWTIGQLQWPLIFSHLFVHWWNIMEAGPNIETTTGSRSQIYISNNHCSMPMGAKPATVIMSTGHGLFKGNEFFISHSSPSFGSVFVSCQHPLFCFDWTIYKPKYCCLDYLYFRDNGP